MNDKLMLFSRELISQHVLYKGTFQTQRQKLIEAIKQNYMYFNLLPSLFDTNRTVAERLRLKLL